MQSFNIFPESIGVLKLFTQGVLRVDILMAIHGHDQIVAVRLKMRLNPHIIVDCAFYELHSCEGVGNFCVNDRPYFVPS